MSKKKAGKGIRFAYVAKGEPPLVCSPSFGYAEIHPFVALSNDKEFRRLRAATNAPRVGWAQAFEKA